jgi:uroporphyrinogen-III synthase
MTGPHRLEGVRVLVTRPRERSAELCFLLEDEGAEVLALPLLELVPPEDPRPLRAAAERVGRWQWIVFASPSGVQALVEAVRQAGTTDALYRSRIAAVGPKTAQTVRSYGLPVTAQPPEGTGAALFEAMRPELLPGDEVLLPAAEEGRRELQQALEGSGHRVTRVVAYRSERAPVAPEQVAELVRSPPAVVLFGSPRTAEAFLDVTGEQGRALLQAAKVVAIGPTTAHALEHMEVPVAEMAETPTSEALVDAAVRAVRPAPPSVG